LTKYYSADRFIINNMVEVITHRGLETSKPGFFPESSFEAFQDQVNRGFGLEFDPNFVKDGIEVWHDNHFGRLTGEKDRFTADASVSEMTQLRYKLKNAQGIESAEGRIPTLNEVLTLIDQSQAPISALHFKGKYQTEENVNKLLKELVNFPDLISRMIIFDVKPDTAKMLLKVLPDLMLAPSVAHPYDVKRFNGVVNETLFTIEETVRLMREGAFGKLPWVWLDEWDLEDKDGGQKKLYTKETFARMKKAGAKIGLVTPELHGTSPGLYGGEKHPDSENQEVLMKRIKEIIDLNPDAICTDYPEESKKLV
jgi:glycerophosphoryl diester phosphodiesterase